MDDFRERYEAIGAYVSPCPGCGALGAYFPSEGEDCTGLQIYCSSSCAMRDYPILEPLANRPTMWPL